MALAHEGSGAVLVVVPLGALLLAQEILGRRAVRLGVARETLARRRDVNGLPTLRGLAVIAADDLVVVGPHELELGALGTIGALVLADLDPALADGLHEVRDLLGLPLGRNKATLGLGRVEQRMDVVSRRLDHLLLESTKHTSESALHTNRGAHLP